MIDKREVIHASIEKRLDQVRDQLRLTLDGVLKIGVKDVNGELSLPYALAATERLGLADKGGMLRVGPVHYNQASLFWVRSPRTLGNRGGDQAVWEGVEEECGERLLTVCVRLQSAAK